MFDCFTYADYDTHVSYMCKCPL